MSVDVTGDPGHVSLGTITVVMDYGGSRSFLTCSHCTRVRFSPDGDTASQTIKNGTGARLVGIESTDPSTYSCFKAPWGWQSCRKSDAAAYTIMSGVVSERGLIARTTDYNGSTTWDTSHPYFVVVGTGSGLVVGSDVNKVGWRTGWTHGSNTYSCSDRHYDTGQWVVCMYGTDAVADSGDSGSPVFNWDGGDEVTLLGIVGAIDGTTWFTPMSQIVQDLTSTMTIARGYNLSTPSLSGSINGSSNPIISWSSVSGSTGYHLFRQWCYYVNLQCTGGTGWGWEYLGRVYGTSYTDAEMTVNSYNGTSPPSLLNYGVVGYMMYAANSRDVSQVSAAIYFTLSP